jgi:hypothetical protein
MKQKLILLFVALALLAAVAVMINRRATTSAEDETALNLTGADLSPRPVLVELFTSEGCSSCPPADELLARLEQTQGVAGAQVIALSEHVDYWNRLGWADPFSSAALSERQSDYARALRSDDIYTPQMIVDGGVEFVGSREGRAREAIAKAARAPKSNIEIALAESKETRADALRLSVRVSDVPTTSADDTAEVMLAITESGLQSNVSRGENAGRRLIHTAVVRKLDSLGGVDLQKSSFEATPVVKLEEAWNRERLKAVVFVQERASRRVLGAAERALARH